MCSFLPGWAHAPSPVLTLEMIVERKRMVPDRSGKMVEGTVVDVDKSMERFSEIELADGTILRAKIMVVEAVRLDNRWDDDGNPVYSLKSQNVVIISESPKELRKPLQ